jgi:hypothetical protein
MFLVNDQSMRLWKRAVVPGLAALAVIFLSGAGVTGIDQMANVKIHSPTSGTASAVLYGGQTSLHHLVLRGLAKGSLPGGFPYDEPRDERYDENYQEAQHQHRSSTSPGQ